MELLFIPRDGTMRDRFIPSGGIKKVADDDDEILRLL